MIPLSEAIRISKNKANFNLRFGRPEDGDYTGAEAFLQRQGEEETRRQGDNPSTPPLLNSSSIPIGPGGNVLDMRRQAGQQILRTHTPFGQVPAGIQNANPGAYFDESLGSTVIGASGRNRNARGGPTWSGSAMKNGAVMQNTNMASFGMAGPNERRGTIGGRGTPAAPDMFGRQFGQPSNPPPMGTTTDGNQSFAPKPWEIPGYASGGEVEGPGGPKDDLVPAMLSDGEFIMPNEVKEVFGEKHLYGMIDKAKQFKADMRDPNPDGKGPPPSGIPHLAAGGLPGFVNPYADDPALYARRQQEARDASLAMSGITDMGGGNMALNNRYGTGYAVPTTQGIPDMPGRFNNGGNTVTAAPGKGLSMVPDVLPPGPWSAPALPWEAQPQRENIAFMQRQMIPGAEGRRADDLATDTRQMALQPKGRRIITVPDANPFPTPNPQSPTPFMAPWEKDQMEAAQRNAPIQPLLDAGMKKSDIRKLMRSPQGMQTLQDMQPEQWTPIPGTDYMQGRKGQTVPMRRAPDAATIPPGMVPDSMTVGGVRYKAPTSANPADSGIHATKDVDGVIYNVMKDGTMKRAVIEDPTPQQKTKAFKGLYDREPKSPQDWSEAYYLASGKPRGETGPPQTSAPPREFKTPEEAMKAGLKPGDRVMVGGRMATWK